MSNLVYVMQVDEVMTFNQYWTDIRFQCKKPRLAGSLKQAFGDNVYLRGGDGRWQQSDSHHSLEDGSPNVKNIRRDTKTDKVLTGGVYAYWGGSGPEIPLPVSGTGAGTTFVSRDLATSVISQPPWLRLSSLGSWRSMSVGFLASHWIGRDCRDGPSLCRFVQARRRRSRGVFVILRYRSVRPGGRAYGPASREGSKSRPDGSVRRGRWHPGHTQEARPRPRVVRGL